MTEIDIKTYTHAELRTLYDDPDWWRQKNLPFSKARLGAYLDNPHAEESDVLWLIAFGEEGIVGYIGMVPDQINSASGSRKMAWFTSWWVDSSVRGSGLADRLMTVGLKFYPVMGGDSGTPWAIRKVLKSGNFFLWDKRPRSFWMLNVSRRALKEFGYQNMLTGALFPLVHGLLGWFMRLRLRAWLKRMGESDLSVEYLDRLDQEAKDLVSSQMASEVCVHGADTLHWRASLLPRMAKLRGIPSGQSSYFGNSGFDVRSYLIKLRKGSQLIGLIDICLADGYLKIPFLYMEEGCERELSVLVGRICLGEKVEVIYSQDKRIKAALERFKLPRWLLKSYPMEVLFSSKDIPSGLRLQDGDGAF